MYAQKDIMELFGEEKLKNAVVKQINYTSSCIAVNQGKGVFKIQNLPVQIQLSSVKSILPD